ncbi:PilZ domain-containing protein [Ahniella affigens]|uniref:Cyclic diguanosine monophosphate-binding protein n=1 Tax=Ahniella affigens TaxID=2021234 RepID=A0A2P1PN55_9GAMM|nr:PilZ domain-containing protein [Ahniella affigens]AVP96271.1 PilZ domain-containing protein [Ahniella affigens]
MAVVPTSQNRRRFQRFAFEGKVRLYSTSAMWESTLLDVSLKGALIARPTDWQGKTGASHRIELRVDDGPRISMAATMVHCSETAIGFKWDRIDLDSFVQLKRLIELNIGNPDLMTEELNFLS